jgi:hypothetical protein
LNTNRLEDLNISEAQRAEVRRLVFYEPLPFVKRVVFIATPHRGSYLSGGLARRLAQRLVSPPDALSSSRTNMLSLVGVSETGKFLNNRMPTSLDGMSPRNPGLLAMSEIQVVPSVKAHSIIPVLGDGDYREGRDGVVSYESAHVEYVESEYIVRSKHSCLNQPATVEEVRRILHEHLRQLNSAEDPNLRSQSRATRLATPINRSNKNLKNPSADRCRCPCPTPGDLPGRNQS